MNLIKKCNCSIDNTSYKLEDLNRLKETNPESKILKNLICPICSCKLEFHRKTDRRRAFLSTWPKEKHSDLCRFRFEYEERRNSSSSYNTLDSYLNGKEVKSKVNYMYNKMHKRNTETENSKDQKKDKHRKNPITTKKASSKKITKTRGSVRSSDSQSANSSGSRMTYREPGGITLQDSGRSITLGGILKKVNLDKTSDSDRAVLYITNDSGKTEKVYTAPAYFSQSTDGLRSRMETLSKIISKTNGQEFICLIYATLDSKSNIQLYLYEEGHMFFPKIPLGVYIYNTEQQNKKRALKA
ncbi:hypothetical protein RZ54_06000 [Apilactobacillus kunkeei]|uniref:hypothetical protein n=1 Tax=Apilactobacillus kunkeei TaxID=148814 RepID=UPI0006C0CC0D|nr:hypothetical protein [Apilactobacillus kunkeei]KOY76873.1 hypothetical protein RZ54_06000 [Apilactobacillus kunkeei]